MDDRTIWELLERVGAVRSGHFLAGDHHADLVLQDLDPLRDPPAAQRLAVALAETLAKYQADVILVWAGLPSVLLGFLVGLSLERPVVRLADDEGVVYSSAPLPAGGHAVLVGETLSEQQVRLARAFATNRGATLVASAALVDTGEGVDASALASLREHRFPAEACPLCQRHQPLDLLTEGVASGAGDRRR